MKNTNKAASYRTTVIACYIGNFVQAAVINLTPILFIPLREQFGLSFSQIGLLIFINFLTQVIFDIAFSGAVDRYGFRPFVVSAHAICVVGFMIFAFSPKLFPGNPYLGFIIGTIVFSGSGGLLELLLSPIINSIPTDEKATAMSVLHSFYAWGQITVVLITTLMLFVFGKLSWPFIVIGWGIVPLVNFFIFIKAPMAPPIPEEHRQGMRELILKPFFIAAFFAILLGGASEVSINQWTSAFMEKALFIPKLIGDTAGMCMFALMLGIGRLLYGIYGSKINIYRLLIWGSFSAVICYLIVALSPVNILSLAACAVCGLSVSLLWPGTLVVTSAKYPLAGAWIFAILAAGGDIGASVGPWFLSVVTEQVSKTSWFIGFAGLNAEQIGLRAGMLAASLFPLGAFLCHKYLKAKTEIAE